MDVIEKCGRSPSVIIRVLCLNVWMKCSAMSAALPLWLKFFFLQIFEQKDAEGGGKEGLCALASATLIFRFLEMNENVKWQAHGWFEKPSDGHSLRAPV